MSCSVVRNSNGTINTVLAENGQESKLFNSINNNLFLGGVAETSLNTYKAILTQENAFKEEGEPKIYFQGDNGIVYEDIEQALISVEGSVFSVGVLEEGSGVFKPVGKFNTEATPMSGYLADAVKTGLLSTERMYDRETGESYLKGKGEYESSQKMSEYLLQDQLATEAGIAVKVNNKGVQVIETVSPYLVVKKKNGEVEVVNRTDAQEHIQKRTTENKVDLIIQTSDILTRQPKEKKKVVNKAMSNIAKNNLESLLQSLGFTVTSLEEYKKGYRMRHGSDIDVAGLVDMNNRIIAIAEGQDVRSVLTEEVAHIAVEAYNDQASIAEALLEVVNTQEYRDFAEQYRDKYSDEYQGAALEEKVRKEILGKVLARELSKNELNNHSRQTLWESFVNYIRGRFKPRQKSVLDTIVKNMQNAIESNDLTQFQKDFAKSGGVYFSLKTNKEITDDIKKIYNDLLGISKQSKKAGEKVIISVRGTSTIVEESLDNISALNKINDVVSSIKDNLESLALKQANNEMTVIDAEIFKALYDKATPALEGFSSWIRNNNFPNKQQEKLAKVVEEDLQETKTKIADLRVEVENSASKTFDEVVEEAIQNVESEEQKEQIRNGFRGLIKDVSSVFRMFTPASASSSPFLRLAGKKIADMYTSVESVFRNFAQQQADNYTKLGWSKAEKAVIARDKKGNKTEYFIDAVSHKDADTAIEDANINYIVAQVPGTKVEDVRRMLRDRETKEDILTNLLKKSNPNITQEEINNKLKGQIKVNKQAQIENKTQYYTKEKFENDEKLLAVANVSEESFADDEAYRRQINDIRSRYFRKDGKFNIEDMSEADRRLMEKVERSRRLQQSPITSSGDFLEGLDVLTWEEMSKEQQNVFHKMSREIVGKDFNPEDTKGKFVVLKDGVTIDSLNSDARYSLDMNNLNIARRLDGVKRGRSFDRNASTQFIEEIDGQKSVIESFNFLRENSSIQYTDEYYEFLEENGVDYVSIAEQYISEEEDDAKRLRKELAFERYKELIKLKASINKAYRSKKDSTEVEPNDMTGSMRKHIIEIDEQIAEAKRIIRVPEDLIVPPEEPLTERRLSKSFNNMQKESGKNPYDFALQHMSSESIRRVENFRAHLEQHLDPSRRPLRDKKFDEIFRDIAERLNFAGSQLSAEEIVERAYTQFAKDNLASYFYGTSLRNQQAVFDKIQDDAFEGKIEVSDILDPKVMSQYSPYIMFQPDYAWSEQDNPSEFVDPEYNQLKGSQPRISKFRNDEFFSRYGVTEEEWNGVKDITELTARSNVNEFEFLKLMVNNNKEVNRIYNTTTHEMLRPQMAQTTYEKINPKNIKNVYNAAREGIKDTFSDRIDDPMYGDVGYNELGMKVIPKLYRQKLEDVSFLTENSFGASMLMLHEAQLYQKRAETKLVLDAIHDQVMHTEFTEGNPMKKGKISVKGELSQTAKGLQEMMDFYLYGIKQSTKMEANVFGRNVDFTKVLTKFQKYSSYVNLMYSPLIALTSLTTGTINNFENTVIEEHYSRNASRRASESLAKDMGAYYMATGAINNKSKMAGLVEMFGLKSAMARFDNSSANRVGRVLSESSFLMDEMANVPVLFKPLYAVLYDTRYFESEDGSKKGYMDYNSFKAYLQTTVPGIQKGEIKTRWGLLEKDTLMDAIDFNKETGAIKFNEKVHQRLTPSEQQKLVNRVGSKAKNLGQQVDGVIGNEDRVLAQRNPILNTLMQHKGFLFINLPRAFKSRAYNFHTGQIEEGHWRTATRLVGEIVKNYKKPTEVFKNLDSLSKKNLARVSLRMAITMLLLALSKMAKATDDEDDPFIEDLARVILYRTYGETKDMSPYGMGQTMWETVKNPVVLSSTIEEWGKLKDKVFPEDGEADLAATGKILRKLTGTKTYDQFSNLHRYTNDWLYYNREKLAPIYNYTEKY